MQQPGRFDAHASGPWKVLCVAGARPNFMKIAPILRALRSDARFDARLVHTGQHYDEKLSRVFFEDLKIPRPDIELAVGSATHAVQTAAIMRRFEAVLAAEQPHVVLVVGDVNSTVACAVVASKSFLARSFSTARGERRRPLVVHVEAGLRSFDEDMPEEINRKLVDAISDVLFVSDPAGMHNLGQEGVPAERTFFVGNVMIDTLLAAREQAQSSRILDTLGVGDRGHALVTLHRPSNVDDDRVLRSLLGVLAEIARTVPIVFPVHPRTQKRIARLGIQLERPLFHVVGPLGYLDFVKVMASARIVLSDSGGVQEETTALGVRCITLRENTERPVTVTQGTNILAGTSPEKILAAFEEAQGTPPPRHGPPLWDGHAAERMVTTLARILA